METVYVRTMKDSSYKFYSNQYGDQLDAPPFERNGSWYILRDSPFGRLRVEVRFEPITLAEIKMNRQYAEQSAAAQAAAPRSARGSDVDIQ